MNWLKNYILPMNSMKKKQCDFCEAKLKSKGYLTLGCGHEFCFECTREIRYGNVMINRYGNQYNASKDSGNCPVEGCKNGSNLTHTANTNNPEGNVARNTEADTELNDYHEQYTEHAAAACEYSEPPSPTTNSFSSGGYKRQDDWSPPNSDYPGPAKSNYEKDQQDVQRDFSSLQVTELRKCQICGYNMPSLDDVYYITCGDVLCENCFKKIFAVSLFTFCPNHGTWAQSVGRIAGNKPVDYQNNVSQKLPLEYQEWQKQTNENASPNLGTKEKQKLQQQMLERQREEQQKLEKQKKEKQKVERQREEKQKYEQHKLEKQREEDVERLTIKISTLEFENQQLSKSNLQLNECKQNYENEKRRLTQWNRDLQREKKQLDEDKRALEVQVEKMSADIEQIQIKNKQLQSIADDCHCDDIEKWFAHKKITGAWNTEKLYNASKGSCIADQIGEGNMVLEHIFNCLDCNLVYPKDICSVCVVVCHKGHKISYEGFGLGSCSCGQQGKHQCLVRDVEEKQHHHAVIPFNNYSDDNIELGEYFTQSHF